MSAPLIRCSCRSNLLFIRCQKPSKILKQTRTKSDLPESSDDSSEINPYHFNDKTPPYFPEQEKISSLQAKYPQVIISREEFKFVKRVLPQKVVPQLPENIEFPTPSGWIPPIASKQPSEYGIGRTKNSMLPVWLEEHRSGRVSTIVKKIHGDIHKLNGDILHYLKQNGIEKEVLFQIHEVGHFIRYKGNHVAIIGEFCLEKGF